MTTTARAESLLALLERSLTGHMRRTYQGALSQIRGNLDLAGIERLLANGDVAGALSSVAHASGPAREVLQKGFTSAVNEAGVKTMARDAKVLKPGMTFKGTGLQSRAALKRLELQFFPTIFAEHEKALRAVFTKGLRDGINPRQLAVTAREMVGLTAYDNELINSFQDALAQGRMRDVLGRSLRDSRYDATLRAVAKGTKSLTTAEMATMTTRYKERLHKWRAETWTRTATLNAAREGQQLAWEEAAEEAKLVGWKTWRTTIDGRERQSHHDANGITVPLSGTFPVDGGVTTPGQGQYNCRCTFTVSFREPRGIEAPRIPLRPSEQGLTPDQLAKKRKRDRAIARRTKGKVVPPPDPIPPDLDKTLFQHEGRDLVLNRVKPMYDRPMPTSFANAVANDNAMLDRLRGELVNAARLPGSTVQRVEISRLRSVQTTVFRDAKLSAARPEVLELPDGRLYLKDGNHRVHEALRRGETTIEVDMFKMQETLDPRKAAALDKLKQLRSLSGDELDFYDDLSDDAIAKMRAAPFKGSGEHVEMFLPEKGPVQDFYAKQLKVAPAELPTARVSLDSLWRTQVDVDFATVEKYIRSGDFASTNKLGQTDSRISIVRFRGKDYILDGHNRATAMKLLGETDVDVRLIDIDAYEATLKVKPPVPVVKPPPLVDPRVRLPGETDAMFKKRRQRERAIARRNKATAAPRPTVPTPKPTPTPATTTPAGVPSREEFIAGVRKAVDEAGSPAGRSLLRDLQRSVENAKIEFNRLAAGGFENLGARRVAGSRMMELTAQLNEQQRLITEAQRRAVMKYMRNVQALEAKAMGRQLSTNKMFTQLSNPRHPEFVPTSGYALNARADALEFWEHMLPRFDGDNPIAFTLGKTDTGRAYVNGTGMFMTEHTGAKVWVHEMSHLLETYRREAGEWGVAMRTERATSKVASRAKGYRANEKFLKGRFINPYMGKVYDDRYTEMLSMAMELMFESPAKLLKDDPALFEDVLEFLRTFRRKNYSIRTLQQKR